MVPNASTKTSSLAHALALSAHTYVCLLVLLIFDWFPHCCTFPELGPMCYVVTPTLKWYRKYRSDVTLLSIYNSDWSQKGKFNS
jgi:hypothetical protein